MSLFRLLVVSGLAYWGYKKFKSLLPDIKSEQHAKPLETDIMMQDPQCRKYIPKNQSFHIQIDEKDFYFCSKTCRDEFLAGYANPQQEE